MANFNFEFRGDIEMPSGGLSGEMEGEFHFGIQGKPGKSAYQYAKEAGYGGTEEEFGIALAKAAAGNGGVVDEAAVKKIVEDYLTENPPAAGQPGITPHIGANGNWFIGDTDTGAKAAGKDGEDGKDGYTPKKGVDYFDGKDGQDGKSAYQYALDGGYTGTEEEFAQKLAQETSGSGIHIGTDAPTDENVNVWIDTDEEAEPVNPGGGSVSAAQSDWDATEGQPGHVLNRTHYKGYETIFPETEIALSEDGVFEGEYESVRYPMDDCVYRITWNGVAYKCQPLFEDGMLLLGDIYEDGSYPFFVEWMNMEADGVFGVYMAVVSNDLVEKVTVGIEKEVYVKIPVEYLPETVKTYTVKIPEGEVDLEATNWDLSESGDKAAETLYHGGRVFLDIPNSSAVVRTELTYYSILLYPDEGWSMLIGSCLQGKRVINVIFAQGTWMPPTA